MNIDELILEFQELIEEFMYKNLTKWKCSNVNIQVFKVRNGKKIIFTCQAIDEKGKVIIEWSRAYRVQNVNVKELVKKCLGIAKELERIYNVKIQVLRN